MLRSLHIRNLRGIQKLDAEGLGRVNLVIGRNEAGKTTFLAAAGMQIDPFSWTFIAPFLDDPRPTTLDWEQHWIPLFRGGDPAIPVQVWGDTGEGPRGWRMEPTRSRGRDSWPAVFTADPGNGQVVKVKKLGDGVTHPLHMSWVPAFVESEATILSSILDLYKAGRTGELLPPLRQVNPNIENVEVAGPNIYVRMRPFPLPLRLGVLGDGARRTLEIALALTDPDRVLIDELENGFHYSTLPLILGMLQSSSPDRQIFATTHRDEVIRAACELFLERGDDGLRIIRLDRGESEHRVVIYTAAEALAGMDSGLELRG